MFQLLESIQIPGDVVFLSMGLRQGILLAILISLIPAISFSQSGEAKHEIDVQIPEVALLGLVSESEADVPLETDVPEEAGNAVDFSVASDDRIWINYSSIVAEKEHRRKVTAKIQGEIPAGLSIYAEASEYTGAGEGALGKPAGSVALSHRPADVIVDIGSCFTGKGQNNGHYIQYSLQRDPSSGSYNSLSQLQTSIQVVYTLTDYN